MAISDTSGVVLSVTIQSGSPHEVTLVEKTLEEKFIDHLLQKLIGDRAHDSDPLNEQLKQEGVELIAPYKNNRREESYPGWRGTKKT